jgi:hypothetical protein
MTIWSLFDKPWLTLSCSGSAKYWCMGHQKMVLALQDDACYYAGRTDLHL